MVNGAKRLMFENNVASILNLTDRVTKHEIKHIC